MTKILGVSRAERYSPNSVERDAQIFNKVVHALNAKSCDVDVVCEDELHCCNDYGLIFSMARSERALRALMDAENRGVVVVNSAEALLQNNRLALLRLFLRHDIPIPNSFEINASTHHLNLGDKPCWIKRADACAQEKSDVMFCSNAHDWEAIRQSMGKDAQRKLIVVEHVEGDLIKFYGVRNQPFFYFYYPTEGNHFSKFGLETINGKPSYFHFDEDLLRSLANKASAVSGFAVYGGDAIVESSGNIKIIDFNDWPSFSLCADEAASAIASHLILCLNNRNRI